MEKGKKLINVGEKAETKWWRLGEIDFNLLVVDDNSTDGTIEYLEKLKKEKNNIDILRRPRKMGLGTAYVDGFKKVIPLKPDFILQMDADLSHNPEIIPKMLKKIKDYDIIIGSRYVSGINVINWPMSRLLLSYYANFYARFVTGLKIKDVTGGFKLFRRKVLENICLEKIRSDGYAFQIEMNYRISKKGFKIKEIPIIFIDRHSGTSKMNKKIMWEALRIVWFLRLFVRK